MNKMIFVLAYVWFLSHSVAAQGQSDTPKQPSSPFVLDSRTGEEIELAQLVNNLTRMDVIFLGEKHDNDAGHEFQLNTITALVDQGVDIVISMEQFERDVQGVVDDYLADRITEQEFLESSRPWKNYAQHYRPIMELAKKNRLPVLAANAPRRLAADVAQGRTIKEADEVFLPRSTSTPTNDYWHNFQETMKGHGGLDATKMKDFYASQCIKDDAMAEAITDYLYKNPHRPKTVVHLCGHFHSDFGLGTAARVMQRMRLARIAVVTMEIIDDDEKKSSRADVRDRGHYIFWTVKNLPTNDPPSNEAPKEGKIEVNGN